MNRLVETEKVNWKDLVIEGKCSHAEKCQMTPVSWLEH